VQPDAHGRQLHRERGGVPATFPVPVLDRLVGDEPSVAPAAEVLARRESADVGLGVVRDADGETVERHVATRREVEERLVGHGQVPVRCEGLVLAVRLIPDGDGPHPRDPVLQRPMLPEHVGDVV